MPSKGLNRLHSLRAVLYWKSDRRMRLETYGYADRIIVRKKPPSTVLYRIIVETETAEEERRLIWN